MQRRTGAGKDETKIKIVNRFLPHRHSTGPGDAKGRATRYSPPPKPGNSTVDLPAPPQRLVASIVSGKMSGCAPCPRGSFSWQPGAEISVGAKGTYVRFIRRSG